MNESPSLLPVQTPTTGVDPRVALATSMHAAPGVYAVLVGSGMSRGAGVRTGWQVVQDLIRRVAIAEGVDPSVVDVAPERWWEDQGRPGPRYDDLLPAIASTDAMRQAVLKGYFDPAAGEGGPIPPTAAHRALAELCSSGRVRVIVTTNFDHLMERALDEVGISPQVVVTDDAVRGMIPLPHAPVTLLKVHGDYAIPGLRNSPEELSTYPAGWNTLLDRVLDEWGLVVVGWSAEYDTALLRAIDRGVSRRYPMYWASYNGHLTEPARQLIARRAATLIDTTGADEFFCDLRDRIRRLDQVSRRREQPQLLRSWAFAPNDSSPPRGWAAQPLLYLRAVATLGPATTDAVGVIAPQHRESVLQTLRVSRLNETLIPLALAGAAPAVPKESWDGATPPLVDWTATPDEHQRTDRASYRKGGDAQSGVSVLAAIQGPSFPSGAGILFTIDVAVSVDRVLRPGEVARLLREGLVLITSDLPDALGEVVPSDASPQTAEIHLLAPRSDGVSQQRESNELLDRIDLSQFGEPTRQISPSLGCAVRLSAPLAEHEAAEIVADAFNRILLDAGYLDPRIGMMTLRNELGLSAQV